MFGGIATAGSDRIVFAAADGSVLFLETETGRIVGEFAVSPSGPRSVHISACAVDGDGSVLLADALHHHVRRFSPEGLPLGRYGGLATPRPGVPHDDAGVLLEPSVILPLADGLLVGCGGYEVEHGLQRLDAAGSYRASLVHPGGGWRRVHGLTRVREEIWAAETEAGAIHRFRLDGEHFDRWALPAELSRPFRMAFDGYDGVLVSFAPETEGEQEELGVARIDLGGNFEGWAVEGGEGEGRAYCPFDLAVLPDGRFVVADLPLGAPPDVRLQLFSADGRLLRTLLEDAVDLRTELKLWFESVLARNDESPATLYEQARIHHFHAGDQPGQQARARDLYRAALQKDPHLLLAHLGLGVLLQHGLGEAAEAETEHRAAMRDGGDEGELLARIAECRHDRGDLDGAIDLMREAVEGRELPEEYHRRVEDLGTWFLERAGESSEPMI